ARASSRLRARLDGTPARLAGRTPMPLQIVNPRIRSFFGLNAHPAGCEANVRALVELARRGTPGRGMGGGLVVGASTGYGLASALRATFGYGARTTAVCLERAPRGERTASAGWYNLAAAQRLARADGRTLDVVNGDAFTDEIKRETAARLGRGG